MEHEETTQQSALRAAGKTGIERTRLQPVTAP
jgi:hypothetical protein